MHSATEEAALAAVDAAPGSKCGSIHPDISRKLSGYGVDMSLETMDHHPVIFRIPFQSTGKPSDLYPDRFPNSGIQLGWNRMTFQWIGIQL